VSDLINTQYVAGCQEDGTSTALPDCGHGRCGVLCDVELTDRRPGGKISELRSSYHLGGTIDRTQRAAEVRELLRHGLTLPEIAATLDVPLDLVVRPLRRDCTGCTAQQYVKAEQLLRAGGLSYGEVGERVGMDRHEVRTFATTLGIKSGAEQANRKYTTEQHTLVRELFHQGVPRKDLPARTGVPMSTVKKWLHGAVSKATAA
jgi:hypothetical protein